jgi:hypothetical protein
MKSLLIIGLLIVSINAHCQTVCPEPELQRICANPVYYDYDIPGWTTIRWEGPRCGGTEDNPAYYRVIQKNSELPRKLTICSRDTKFPPGYTLSSESLEECFTFTIRGGQLLK